MAKKAEADPDWVYDENEEIGSDDDGAESGPSLFAGGGGFESFAEASAANAARSANAQAARAAGTTAAPEPAMETPAQAVQRARYMQPGAGEPGKYGKAVREAYVAMNSPLHATPKELADAAQAMISLSRRDDATLESLGDVIDTINQHKLPTGDAYRHARADLAEARKVAIQRIRSAARPKAMKPKAGKGGYGIRTDKVQVQVPSGTTAGILRYGKNAQLANPTQIYNRATDNYVGNGAYLGRMLGKRLGGMIPGIGGFVSDFAGDLGSRAEDYATKKLGSYIGNGAYIHSGPDGQFEDYNGDGVNDLASSYVPGAKDIDFVGMRQQAMKRNRAEGLDRQDDFHGRGLQDDMQGPRLHTNQLIDPHQLFSRKPPMIMSSKDETGDLYFSHREFLTDIQPKVGSGTGFVTQLLIDINAGLYNSFPLLSEFAEHYSQYKFEKLIIRFRSLITEGNSSAAGSIMLATIYNPNDADFATKRSLENSEYSVSGKVTDTLDMGIECDTKKTAHSEFSLTRIGPVANKTDYDICRVQIATQGATEGLLLGEIWAEYTCRLSKLSVTGTRPLVVGDGMCLSWCPTSGDVAIRGWIPFVSGTNVSTDAVRYPMASWGSPATTDAPTEPALVGSLVVNPGIPLSLLGNNRYTEAAGFANSVIQSYSQSRDIEQSIDWAPNFTRMTFVFNTVTGAEYAFVFNSKTRGQIDPALGAILQLPAVTPPDTLGKINVRVNSGLVRMTGLPASATQTTLLIGQAFYTTTPNTITRFVNTWLTGVRFYATGQGQASITFDFDNNSFPVNSVACDSMGWNFTRLI